MKNNKNDKVDGLPELMNKHDVTRPEFQVMLACADHKVNTLKMDRIPQKDWDKMLELTLIVLKSVR